MTIERDIEIPQGSAVRLRFTLTVRGVGPWNVASAAAIDLLVSDENGAALTPIALDDSDPTADWETGKAVALVGGAYTATSRRLGYALRVSIGDEVVIPIRGALFVEQTPGL